MKHIYVIAGVVSLILSLGYNYALADDAVKSADASIATDTPVDEAVSKDAVSDAEKKIDDAIKDIDEDPGEAINAIVEAFKEGRWGPAIGMLLMLLVWVLRKFLWKLIPKNALPWVTLGAGCAIVITVELIAGVTWWKTLIDGFGTSASAMALWSLLFKHLIGEKKEA